MNSLHVVSVLIGKNVVIQIDKAEVDESTTINNDGGGGGEIQFYTNIYFDLMVTLSPPLKKGEKGVCSNWK